MLKRIAVTELCLGMYIHEFCGSWMDHPFWRGRFLLDNERDLQRVLDSEVHEVWIDVSKGLDVAAGQASQTVEEVVAIGPLIMMKFVALLTKKYNIPTTVSLNPLMVDGTGMCGGCRVKVGNEIKFACVHGPEFDGLKVDFDSLLRRSGRYKHEEKCRLDSYIEETKNNG